MTTVRRSQKTLFRSIGTALATMVAAAAIALVGAGPAAAGPPVVDDEGSYDDTYDVPAAAFPCGVDVTFHEVGTYRLTTFFDRHGAVVRQTGHIGGTTTITSDHGQITNHWRENGTLDPATGTITWSGNSFNIHGGAGGVLVNTSGRWVVDAATDELLDAVGPQEDPEEHFGRLCAVLAP